MTLLGLIMLQMVAPLLAVVRAQQSVTGPSGTLGEQDVLVIPVEFQDVNHTLPLSAVKGMFDLANGYINQMSHNQTWLNVTVARQWYMLPGNFSEYTYSNNLSGIPPMVRAASLLAGEEYNLSARQHIVVLHAGYNPTLMRSEAWGLVHEVILSERDTPLAVVHELLHSMGGVINGTSGQPLRVQDLYDEAAVEAGAADWATFVGNWDIMSTSDVGPSAFTYLKLGWMGAGNVMNDMTCGDMPISLYPLEVSSNGTQVIRIPISDASVSLVNGTTVPAPTYLLVEYRERIGADENISAPSVIVTRASDMRYYGGLPGPVVLSDVLAFTPGSSNIFSDSADNVSIIVLGQSSNLATVVVACPSRSADYSNATNLVYSAVSRFGQASDISNYWFDIGPSLQSIGTVLNDSLANMSIGNLDSATSDAIQVLAMIAAKQQSSTIFYFGSAILVDLIFTFLFFFMLLPQPKRSLKLHRVYVFDRHSLIKFLLLAIVVIGASISLQVVGLAQDSYGISSLSKEYLQSGQGILFVGFLFWIVGLLALWLLVKDGQVDVESRDDEPESR